MKVLFGINIGLMIILKYLYLGSIRYFDLRVDYLRTTPSDYTLLIKGIAKYETEASLRTFFELKVPGVKVEKINFVHNIQHIYDVTQQLMKLDLKIHVLKRKGEEDSIKYKNAINERKKQRNEFSRIRDELTTKEGFEKTFTGNAFVTFSYKNDADEVMNKMNHNLHFLSLKKSKYSIKRAKEPEDVLWQNFGLTMGQRIMRRLASFVVSAFLIAASLGLVLLVKLYQESLSETLHPLVIFSVSIIISMVLTIINYFLRLTLRKLTAIERRTSYSSLESGIVFKISVAYFVNTAVVVLLTNLIVQGREIWGAGGVIGNILTIQAISIISDSAFYLVNPFHFFKIFKRIYYISKIKLLGDKNKILQYELNQTYQGDPFDLAERYYTAFKTITVVFFFQTVMPYLLLFGIVEFVFTYWVQKFVLVRRCNRPRDIDFGFSLKSVENFEMSMFIMALGYLTFEKIVTGNISLFIIIIVIITGCEWLIFQIAFFIPCCRGRKKEREEEAYQEAWHKFYADYDRLNPITQREATEKWMEANGLASNIRKMRASLRIKPDKKTIKELLNSKVFFKNVADYVQTNNMQDNFKSDIPLKISRVVGKQSKDDFDKLNIYEITKDANKNKRSLVCLLNEKQLASNQGFKSFIPWMRKKLRSSGDDLKRYYPTEINIKLDTSKARNQGNDETVLEDDVPLKYDDVEKGFEYPSDEDDDDDEIREVKERKVSWKSENLL